MQLKTIASDLSRKNMGLFRETLRKKKGKNLGGMRKKSGMADILC